MRCDICGTGAHISINTTDKCIIPPSLQEGILHYAVENTQFGFTHLVTACKKAQTHSEKAASRARSDTHNTCMYMQGSTDLWIYTHKACCSDR